MRWPRLSRVACTAAVLALVGTGCQAGDAAVSSDDPLVVAAAANLRPAFEELGETFEAETGHPVTFSFGSSGQLAQQIVEGAPMDVYAAANADFVDRVLAAGRGDRGSRTTYAVGRLAIWASGDAWGGWESLEAVAADPAVGTVAIANPEHAPYGAAARQALESAAVWDEVRPDVVYGANVADAQRMAATGDADVGVVALSLVIAEDGDDGGWTRVPAELHDPLRQDLVVTADDAARQAAAAQFRAHITSPAGQATLARYGFDVEGVGETRGG